MIMKGGYPPSLRTDIIMLRRQFVRYLSQRSSRRTSPIATAFQTDDEEVRYRTEKNPVIPSLTNLEKRWPKMDAGSQDDVIAYLEDLMRDDWRKLTTEQQKASMFVWYGPWGPRSTKKERDPADLLTYYSIVIGAAGGGLILYKLATFDSTKKIPGIDYGTSHSS